MKLKVVGVVAVLMASCSGGSDGPSDEITRIDGPAVVDEDQGRADNGASDDPSDG